MYVNQMDESDNLGPGAPSINDLNNVLRSFVDDPNNEVRTYSDSLYIPTENVENILSQYPNNFSVFSLNIQSWNSKFDPLLAFLSHLDEKGYNFDAFCLQETWLSPKCDTSFSIYRGITSFIKAKHVVSTHHLSFEYFFFIPSRIFKWNRKYGMGNLLMFMGKTWRVKLQLGIYIDHQDQMITM